MPLSNTSWASDVNKKLTSNQIAHISSFLDTVYRNEVVFPPKDKVFAALEATALQNTKVIIMGQDPYHELGQAQGLSFSVPDSIPAPPSLRNILTELSTDIGTRDSHDLVSWATQGVLLLNAVLTVQEGHANAHAKGVWEPLTDAIIQIASEDNQPKVFILWGKYAQSKQQLIDKTKHLVITSSHPSPLSAYRGFFGSRPFSRTNDFLSENGRELIKWLK